jgi:putative ABC transport system ATP-binding protein
MLQRHSGRNENKNHKLKIRGMMINIDNVSKIYRRGGKDFKALQNISLAINQGDYIVVTGASGAGKSTLLNTIGGLIKPDSGEVLFNGKDLYRNGGAELAAYRKMNVGFMFQQFHLMPYLTVYENIKLACYDEKYLADIDSYLDRCLLADLKNKYPSELSVGEKQRTAFIRAIITHPGILLADEPTGNLDPVNSSILFTLIDEFNMNGGTVVVVSHDTVPAKNVSGKVLLDKGKIAG